VIEKCPGGAEVAGNATKLVTRRNAARRLGVFMQSLGPEGPSDAPILIMKGFSSLPISSESKHPSTP
jgi:hypothetical protein